MTSVEPLTAEHFGIVAGWLSNSDVNQWLTSEWRGRTVDPTTMAMAVRNKRNRLFLVRSDGRACGVVGLSDWDGADCIAMIWYLLGESGFEGRGITTTAVRQLARTAFEELGIEVLYAWIMQDNQRSRRVLEKAGFTEAGTIRSGTLHNGHRVDRVYFDLTKQSYENGSGRLASNSQIL